MTSATVDTTKAAALGINDGNLTVDVDLSDGTATGINDTSNAFEGAGVVWATAQTVGTIKFINGTASSGNGYFMAGLVAQYTTNGTTWVNTGWAVTPAYTFAAGASGITYKFTAATALTGVRGVRIVGQVNTATTSSKHARVREVQVYAGLNQ